MHSTGSGTLHRRHLSIHTRYNVFNNLIGRTVQTFGVGGTTTTQRYVFDGTNMVLAFDGSQALTDRYFLGPAVDQVLADEKVGSGNTLWSLGDNQNSVTDLVNDNGTVAEHISYNPFGQQTSAATVDFVFGYTGTYTDPLTNLQLHGRRWYDSASQRWLSQDPSGLQSGDANLYRYCGNGPTDGRDPGGLGDVYDELIQRQKDKMRDIASQQKEVAAKLRELEQKHDSMSRQLLAALKGPVLRVGADDRRSRRDGYDYPLEVMRQTESDWKYYYKLSQSLEREYWRAFMTAMNYAVNAERDRGLWDASGGLSLPRKAPSAPAPSDDIPLWQYFIPIPTPYGPVFREEIEAKKSPIPGANVGDQLYKLEYKAAPYFWLAETGAFGGANLGGAMEYTGDLEEILDFLFQLADEQPEMTPEQEAFEDFTNPGRYFNEPPELPDIDDGYDGWLDWGDQYHPGG
jgi:RHS repeat-associated protein